MDTEIKRGEERGKKSLMLMSPLYSEITAMGTVY